MNILEYYHLNFELSICIICDLEGRIYQGIVDQLRKEYPEETKTLEDKSLYKGIPANHPFWLREKELLRPHLTNCLVFNYDDAYEPICKKHLQEVIDKF